jgi:uncharacterized protein with HEPN domain
MRVECKKYLHDIQKACRHIEEFAAGKTFSDYLEDALLQSGVERQFEIIGEALGQMLKVDPGLADAITESRRIISFRNILIHGYSAISSEVVWDILQTKLPTLRAQVDRLLSGH